MEIYLAGPFFCDAHVDIIAKLENLIERLGHKVWSPRKECMYKPGETTAREIIDLNCKALLDSDLVVVVTDFRDPGTFFESGFCWANEIPMLYVWIHGDKTQKFNLMLAGSGSVARSYEQVEQAINEFSCTGGMRGNYDEESLNLE